MIEKIGTFKIQNNQLKKMFEYSVAENIIVKYRLMLFDFGTNGGISGGEVLLNTKT